MSKSTAILNLTQHPATPDQIAAGVYDPAPEERAEIVKLLTFEDIPTSHDLRTRASELAFVAACIIEQRYKTMTPEERELDSKYGSGNCAMIGGAPYFMSALVEELSQLSIYALYAFSARESVEQVMPDGSVRKTAVFRHRGFVPA